MLVFAKMFEVKYFFLITAVDTEQIGTDIIASKVSSKVFCLSAISAHARLKFYFSSLQS